MLLAINFRQPILLILIRFNEHATFWKEGVELR